LADLIIISSDYIFNNFTANQVRVFKLHKLQLAANFSPNKPFEKNYFSDILIVGVIG